MDVTVLRELIFNWKEHSWLSSCSFDCSSSILSSAINDFYTDYKRWYLMDKTIDIQKLCVCPQLVSVLLFRISHKVWKLGGCADAFSLLARDIGQIEMYYSATIGSGFKINHGIGTVIGARCIIGNNCTIHQNCTIGDRNGGRPTIGNNVMIYAGSMILGDITIGDNCIIGANSVVTHSCPPNSILVGSPAGIINK